MTLMASIAIRTQLLMARWFRQEFLPKPMPAAGFVCTATKGSMIVLLSAAFISAADKSEVAGAAFGSQARNR